MPHVMKQYIMKQTLLYCHSYTALYLYDADQVLDIGFCAIKRWGKHYICDTGPAQ